MEINEKIQRLEEILESEEQNPLTHFMLGREYMEAERFTDGARELQRSVELNPQYTAAYRFLGDCYRKAGLKTQAREAYETGIAVAQETGDLQAGKEMEVFLTKLSNP